MAFGVRWDTDFCSERSRELASSNLDAFIFCRYRFVNIFKNRNGFIGFGRQRTYEIGISLHFNAIDQNESRHFILYRSCLVSVKPGEILIKYICTVDR